MDTSGLRWVGNIWYIWYICYIWYILPVVHPDGYKWTQEGEQYLVYLVNLVYLVYRVYLVYTACCQP